MTTAESTAQLVAQARSFLELMKGEQLIDTDAGAARSRQITHSVARTGHYSMDSAELAYASRVAWRNSSRCIGRLPWRTLTVLDRRDRESAEEIFQACLEHLRLATNGGRIKPVMSVFAADVDGRPRARIWNPQLIRYAGWRRLDGTVLGDPLHVGFTSALEHLGWQPAERTRSPCSRWQSRWVPGGRSCSSCLPTRCSRFLSGTPSCRGSPSWACAGTRCRWCAGWRWRPVA